MLEGRDSVRRSTLAAWGGLILVGIVIAFACLGSYSTFGSHEVVGVVPAREMLQSGDWIVPRFGAVPRTRKPPLLYWLVASSSWLFGEFSEFTARFHSAIAFLGLAALMSAWALRWYGREAAFGAALIQFTSFWSINWGRHVEIDLVMCLMTTGAMFLIANQSDEELPASSRWRWLAVFSLIGLTWLAKFHYGTAMILGPVCVGWVIQRRWRNFGRLFNPAGVVIALASALIWPWLLIREVPEALERIRFETIGRATGQIGYDPWWFYVPKLLLLTLPWTGHLLITAYSSWTRAWRHGDVRERFLWVWLIVDAFIVSLSPNKHINYLLAVMPVTTLLASQTIARGLAKIHRGEFTVPKFVPHAVALTVALGLLLGLVWKPVAFSAVSSGIQTAIGVALCGLIGSWWCWQIRRRSAAGWTSLVAAAGVFVALVSQVTPQLDGRRITADFARQVRREYLKDQPVCVYARRGALPGFHPSIFYLDSPVYQVTTLSELLREVTQSGMLWAVVEQQNLPTIRTYAPFVELDEVIGMTPPPGSREQPLVCVRLTDRRQFNRTTDLVNVPEDSTNRR